MEAENLILLSWNDEIMVCDIVIDENNSYEQECCGNEAVIKGNKKVGNLKLNTDDWTGLFDETTEMYGDNNFCKKYFDRSTSHLSRH